LNDRLDELVDLIPECLVMTRGTKVYTGLSREDAIRRAEALREAIRGGRARPAEDVVLNDDSKEVLHALVFLLGSSANDAESLFVEAGKTYSFLRSVEWGDDLLGEKEGLLRDCTDIARRAAGCDAPRGAAAADSCAASQGEDEREVFSAFQAGAFDEQGRRAAAEYFAVPLGQRTAGFTAKYLSDPNVLSAICGLLRDMCDVSPSVVAAETELIYRWLSAPHRTEDVQRAYFRRIASGEKRASGRGRSFLDDEHDYFLAETAFLAAWACRRLGRYADAGCWLDRAEAGYRHVTVLAQAREIGLANVAYHRLGLRYDMRHPEEVLDLLPSLIRSVEELKLEGLLIKCRLVEALALKECGRLSEALACLLLLCENPAVKSDRVLYGRVLSSLGNVHGLEKRFDAAVAAYQKALPLLQESRASLALADLKGCMGEALQGQGRLAQAVLAYRAAQRDLDELGMSSWVAYYHLVIAETFLTMERPREAEREVLTALPAIEEHRMVPEGLAILALLKQSAQSQKTDPEALRRLRESLRAKEVSA
jgi:tetratricopeptide (TPR) repeat protein